MENTLLLVGNPNSGKSTLFNRLCGAHRRTGNWSGVSVDSGQGYFSSGGRRYTVTDLPGAYSLEPISEDEKVTADYLSKNGGVIVNIVDASALERALLFTCELLSLRRPTIVALNMADETEKCGIHIDCKKLEQMLGVRVVSISALYNKGVDELVIAASNAQAPPTLKSSPSAIAKRVISRTNKVGVSDSVDSLILQPRYGVPLMIALFATVLWVVFGGFGMSLKNGFAMLLENGVRLPLRQLMCESGINPILRSFIADGALCGIFGVLSFLPQITLLFFLLSVMEDVGIMARIAFLSNPLLGRFGLSGKALIPLCVGLGCTVPAVMSARVADARTRRILYFVLPFVSCPARAPVYALFVSAFFADGGLCVAAVIYLFGIIMALLCAKLLSGGKSDADFFVTELPKWRVPSPRTLFLSVWDKCRGFVQKAGTVIFLASSAVWLLQNLGLAGFVSSQSDSLLALVGRVFAPVLRPLGFGDGFSAASLIMGLFAKETIVSTLEILCGGVSLPAAISASFTKASAVSFMVFSLLYAPCAATFAAIGKEGGYRTALLVAAFDFAVAYAVSAAVYFFARFIF